MSHRISRALLIAGLITAAPALAAAAPHSSPKSAPAEAPAWKAYAYADVKLSFEAPKAPKVNRSGAGADLSADYIVSQPGAILMVSAVDLTSLHDHPPLRDAADTAGLIYRAKPKVTPADLPGATALDWSLHAANGTDILGRVIAQGRFEYRISAVLNYSGADTPAAKARLKDQAERFIKSVSITP
jgi:hypothetical protein